MDKISTVKFDPEEHQNNLYEAFVEFLDEFTYEYDAIAKDPPKDLDAAAKTAWISRISVRSSLRSHLAISRRLSNKLSLRIKELPSHMRRW